MFANTHTSRPLPILLKSQFCQTGASVNGMVQHVYWNISVCYAAWTSELLLAAIFLILIIFVVAAIIDLVLIIFNSYFDIFILPQHFSKINMGHLPANLYQFCYDS